MQASVPHVSHWVVDQEHRVRAGIAVEDTTVSLVVRTAGGGEWRRLFPADVFGVERVTPLGFGRDPDRLFITANHEGRRAVFELDLASPGLTRTLKLADDRFDTKGSLIVRDVRFVTQPGGDHNLSRYEQHLEFLRELEKFLAGPLALEAP